MLLKVSYATTAVIANAKSFWFIKLKEEIVRTTSMNTLIQHLQFKPPKQIDFNNLI